VVEKEERREERVGQEKSKREARRKVRERVLGGYRWAKHPEKLAPAPSLALMCIGGMLGAPDETFAFVK
jgi:hypothetical protein